MTIGAFVALWGDSPRRARVPTVPGGGRCGVGETCSDVLVGNDGEGTLAACSGWCGTYRKS